MEPIDDAEFWLPPEFLSDEDFLVTKDNDDDHGGIDEVCHGFGLRSTVKPKSDGEIFLAGLSKRMVLPTVEDDFSGGFRGGYGFPVTNDDKASDTTRTTMCGAGIGCGCRNQRPSQNRQPRVSSQAAWDLYCTAVDEVTRMNISDDYNNNHSGGGLVNLPRKQPISAAKSLNNGTGYFNNHTLPYQKLQAIQFQQLKEQQLLKNHSRFVQQSRGVTVSSNKNGGGLFLSSSAWSSNLPRRDDSCMRNIFPVGNHTGNRCSTGTGVFLPRRVSRGYPATAVKPTDESWRKQRSKDSGFVSSQVHGGVKAEQQPVNELMLPSDWTY